MDVEYLNMWLIEKYGNPNNHSMGKIFIYLFSGPDEIGQYRYYKFQVREINKDDKFNPRKIGEKYYHGQVFHTNDPELLNNIKSELIEFNKLKPYEKSERKDFMGYRHVLD